jgi:hypothetical protein
MMPVEHWHCFVPGKEIREIAGDYLKGECAGGTISPKEHLWGFFDSRIRWR